MVVRISLNISQFKLPQSHLGRIKPFDQFPMLLTRYRQVTGNRSRELFMPQILRPRLLRCQWQVAITQFLPQDFAHSGGDVGASGLVQTLFGTQH